MDINEGNVRVAVVTGASSGIGKAVAMRLHRDGYRLVLTGRRAERLRELAEELGSRVSVNQFDATDPDGVATAVDSMPSKIDVLVNNAGGNTDFDRSQPAGLAEVAAAWRANLDANLISAALVTSALCDRIRTGGSVINIGSIAADKGAGSYGAAKAGLASWTVDLARTLGDRGITANTLAPGYVASTEFFRDRLPESRRESLVDAALTGRASEPDDIAATAAFLASPEAGQITGQVIAVNGGECTSR